MELWEGRWTGCRWTEKVVSLCFSSWLSLCFSSRFEFYDVVCCAYQLHCLVLHYGCCFHYDLSIRASCGNWCCIQGVITTVTVNLIKVEEFQRAIQGFSNGLFQTQISQSISHS
jgi:hypothetical protein